MFLPCFLWNKLIVDLSSKPDDNCFELCIIFYLSSQIGTIEIWSHGRKFDLQDFWEIVFPWAAYSTNFKHESPSHFLKIIWRAKYIWPVISEEIQNKNLPFHKLQFPPVCWGLSLLNPARVITFRHSWILSGLKL